MKIFLDDIRTPDFIYTDESYEETMEWVIVRHPHIFLAIMEQVAGIQMVSLDHDLGDEFPTGYDVLLIVADWAQDHQALKQIEYRVHSVNPVGRERMEGVIERYLND